MPHWIKRRTCKGASCACRDNDFFFLYVRRPYPGATHIHLASRMQPMTHAKPHHLGAIRPPAAARPPGLPTTWAPCALLSNSWLQTPRVHPFRKNLAITKLRYFAQFLRRTHGANHPHCTACQATRFRSRPLPDSRWHFCNGRPGTARCMRTVTPGSSVHRPSQPGPEQKTPLCRTQRGVGWAGAPAWVAGTGKLQ